MADITPPVALAAYAGSAIAKSNPMKTGITATKLAVAAFIVPYIFAYNPEMLFMNGATVIDVVIIGITALLGLFSVATAINGFLYCNVPVVLRLVLLGAGLCMMIPGLLTDVIGLVVLAAVVVYQYTHAKKINAAAA